MDEITAIDLVKKAIGLYDTTNCLVYKTDKLQAKIRNDLVLKQVGNPAELRMILVRYVVSGGRVDLRKEGRDDWKDEGEFWFRVRVPVPGYPEPLFFELGLTDEDCDYPSVAILNVHF